MIRSKNIFKKRFWKNILLPPKGLLHRRGQKIRCASVRHVRPYVRPSGPKMTDFGTPKITFLQLYTDFGESKSGHFPFSAKNVRISCPHKMSASDVRKMCPHPASAWSGRPILCKSPFGATRPCGCNLVTIAVIAHLVK